MTSLKNDDLYQLLEPLVGYESILRPETPEYNKSNTSYYAASANEVKPALIVQPRDSTTVSDIVKALRPFLLTGKCQIAIRGEGHTPSAHSANIENGITIDLREMKGIVLDEDTMSVKISVGETWRTVYSELLKQGYTTAGGRAASVGVGGLLVGGGLSLFSYRTGFSCDYVTDFEVVLASGQVVRANLTQNKDLLVALRGGMNNLGIVTSFTMKAFKQGPIWGGQIYYPPDAATVTHAYREICHWLEEDTDEDTHWIFVTGYGFGFQVALAEIYQTKGIVSPPSLQRFVKLEAPPLKEVPPLWRRVSNWIYKQALKFLLRYALNSLRTSTHLDFCEEVTKHSKPGQRCLFASLTIRPDPGLLTEFYEVYQVEFEKVKHAKGMLSNLVVQPLTRSLLLHSQEAGGSVMSIDPADAPLLIVLLCPQWHLQTDDERVYETFTLMLTEFKNRARTKGLLHRFVFPNYAFEKEDVISSFRSEGITKLRNACEKWDPEGLFQTAVPGGFKLPKLQ